MVNSRIGLAELALNSGTRLRGVPLNSACASFTNARRQLTDAGVKPGNIVGMINMSSEQLLINMAAAWALDAVPWPLLSERLIEGCSIALDSEGIIRRGSTIHSEDLADVALLHTTSGSTATPKTARRSLASVIMETAGYRNGMQLCAADRLAVPLPVSHSLSSGVAISALLSGCDVHADHRRTPSMVADDLDVGRCNKAVVTPALARLLTQTRQTGVCKPEMILVAAGSVADDLAFSLQSRFRIEMTYGYGSTETGGTFIGKVGIGDPIEGVEVVWPPENQKGELVLRTATVVLGYVGDPLRTSRIWRTGDVVDRGQRYVLRFIKRRSDDSLRVNSRFVDMRPIHSALEAIPEVFEHVAIVMPDDRQMGAETVYLIVATEHLSATGVARRLSHLSKHVTARVVTCSALPRNVMGKLDRSGLTCLVRQSCSTVN